LCKEVAKGDYLALRIQMLGIKKKSCIHPKKKKKKERDLTINMPFSVLLSSLPYTGILSSILLLPPFTFAYPTALLYETLPPPPVHLATQALPVLVFVIVTVHGTLFVIVSLLTSQCVMVG
jgi:hypothetical protein